MAKGVKAHHHPSTRKQVKKEHPTLGILRLDYDYPAALGDIDNPRSFSYPVIYRVVPGLTFYMCQKDEMTAQVENEFDEAVLWLANKKRVNAITGDCGFMMWFAERARTLVPNTPVFISPLMQLRTIFGLMCSHKDDKFLIFTANLQMILPMKDLINSFSGAFDNPDHFKFIGCENVKHFGRDVAQGSRVDTRKAEPHILKLVKESLDKENHHVKAILLECTEMPPYANAIREATGLPVFDAITNCDVIMNSFLDYKRFGTRHDWYEKWNFGLNDFYRFGQELTPLEKRKLQGKTCFHGDLIRQKDNKNLFDQSVKNKNPSNDKLSAFHASAFDNNSGDEADTEVEEVLGATCMRGSRRNCCLRRESSQVSSTSTALTVDMTDSEQSGVEEDHLKMQNETSTTLSLVCSRYSKKIKKGRCRSKGTKGSSMSLNPPSDFIWSSDDEADSKSKRSGKDRWPALGNKEQCLNEGQVPLR